MRRLIWIVLLLVLCLCVSCVVFASDSFQSPFFTTPAFVTPIPPTELVLPLQGQTSTPQVTLQVNLPYIASEATPTMTVPPTEDQVEVRWRLIDLQDNAYIHPWDGKLYDLGTFEDVDNPSVLLFARCLDQGNPNPTIGAIYTQNKYTLILEPPEQHFNWQRFSPVP